MKKTLLTVLAVATLGAGNVQAQTAESNASAQCMQERVPVGTDAFLYCVNNKLNQRIQLPAPAINCAGWRQDIARYRADVENADIELRGADKDFRWHKAQDLKYALDRYRSKVAEMPNVCK